MKVMSRASIAALLVAVLAAAGCGLAPLSAPGGGHNGTGTLDAGAPPTVSELVRAQIASAEVPARVALGEGATLTVHGTHPDPCTTLARFDTASSGGRIDVTVWSARPVGPCTGSPVPFDGQDTLSGLSVGLYEVTVNGIAAGTLAVTAAPLSPVCASPDRVTVTGVTLPPATWPSGSAVVHVSGTLPSWCEVLAAPVVTLSTGQVTIGLAAEGCPSANDPSVCPPGAQPVDADVEVGPLSAGTVKVVVDGSSYGSIQVVPASRCTLSQLPVATVSAAGPISEDQALPVHVEGHLTSSCAALDGPTVQVGTDTVKIAMGTHACDPSCAPADRKVSFDLPIDNLSAGTYTVDVDGVTTTPVTVLAAGACRTDTLPTTAVAGAIATSGSSSLAAGTPLDVAVWGSLPSGCWRQPSVTGRVNGSTLALTLSSDHCSTDCGSGGQGYVVAWSSPGGLPSGSYAITVDGAQVGTFDLP